MYFRAAFTTVLLVGWIVFLARGAGSVPALGPMLSLKDGVWDHHSVVPKDTLIPGLKNPVTVTYDESGVAHLFAKDEGDLYRAQGFLMASQRLFQMDLLTRITDGRLSEWFGPVTQKTDEFFVKFGMRDSARRTLQKFSEDPRIVLMLESYVEGVNAYIRMLQELPPEYKIIGQAPELWTTMRVIHMDKQLTFGLAGRSYDVYLSRIQQILGTEKTLDLFPLFDLPDLDDFIIPPKAKKVLRSESVRDFKFTTSLLGIPFFPLPAAGNGSNNWAVSAKRSTTGASILANDNHLSQTLPNIWWETQLVTPQFNVYGVALAAVPGIVNGFNKDVAWGPTNGTLDVLDYYELKFESEDSTRYKYGDEWLDAEVQRESIKIRNAASVNLDVLWTKYGVVMHRELSRGLAAAWVGHSSNHELKALRGLYEAQNLDECLRSFTAWSVPVQNFICADRTDVSIQHTGFLPERQIGEGRFIMDGTGPALKPLARAIPEADRPRSVRPVEGFVLSANQRVTDASYPHYMGWDFEDPFRGKMIRRRLLEKAKVSPQDMMQIQNDSYELPAELALPLMLKALGQPPDDPELKSLIESLKAWDFVDRPDALAPAVFKAWFEAFAAAVFEDEFLVQSRSFRPKDTRFIELLRRVLANPKDSDRQWVDNKATRDKVETLPELAASSLYMAATKMRDRMGSDRAQWNYKNWVKTRLLHVAHFPGFDSPVLSMAGSADSIRGNQGTHGAVYKIVVALGDWPQAWIQVPGGNEGDPFNQNYGRFAEDWAEGKMRQAEYYRNLEDAKAHAKFVITLSPEGAS